MDSVSNKRGEKPLERNTKVVVYHIGCMRTAMKTMQCNLTTVDFNDILPYTI